MTLLARARKTRSLLPMASLLLLAAQLYKSFSALELPLLDFLGYALLGVNLYSLNLSARLFRRDPSNVVKHSKLARFGPSVLCMGLVATTAAVSQAISEVAVAGFVWRVASPSAKIILDGETLLRETSLTVFLLCLTVIIAFAFPKYLGFRTREDRKKYEWVFSGFIVTSVFLGFGGDLFISVAVASTAFLSGKPMEKLDAIERSFWLVWKKARVNPEYESFLTTLVFSSLILGTNLRFFDWHSPSQAIFVVLTIIPMYCSYLGLRTENLEKKLFLINALSVMSLIFLMVVKPEQLPTTAFIIEYVRAQSPFWNPPFFLLYLLPIVATSMLLGALIQSLVLPNKYRFESLDLDLFRSFVSRLSILVLLGVIFEILALPRNIAQLAYAFPPQVNIGITQTTVYRIAAPICAVLSFGVALIFLIEDLMEVRGIFRVRKIGGKVIYRHIGLTLLCLASVSILLIAADSVMMSNNQTTLRERVTIYLNNADDVYAMEVKNVNSWIFINITQASNDLFDVEVREGSSYTISHAIDRQEITTGAMNACVGSNTLLHFVSFSLANNTDTDQGGVFDAEVHTACFQSLAGGALYYVPLPSLLLLAPHIYSIPARKRRHRKSGINMRDI